MTDSVFDEVNEAKANMDHIYDRPDPRAYFNELKKFDYAIPGIAKPLFEKLLDHLRGRRGGSLQILDLGCSYGINASLLKYDLSLDELIEHWGQRRLMEASAEEVLAYDRRFFRSYEQPDDLEVVGMDLSSPAIDFAKQTGLLDDGFALDLESEPMTDEAAAAIDGTDLVTSTGCIGYIGATSFDRLMPVLCQNGTPWIANFVARIFSFDAIAETLRDWGYVTEKLEGRTFFQRRFVSVEEREDVLGKLDEMGIDSEGKERDGALHAEFFLSRPADEARRTPLSQLALA